MTGQVTRCEIIFCANYKDQTAKESPQIGGEIREIHHKMNLLQIYGIIVICQTYFFLRRNNICHVKEPMRNMKLAAYHVPLLYDLVGSEDANGHLFPTHKKRPTKMVTDMNSHYGGHRLIASCLK